MDYNKDKLKYINLDKWIKYKGKGINVGTLEAVNSNRILNYKVVNSSNSGARHGSTTALTLLELVPECTLHSVPYKVDNIKFIDYVKNNDIKVIFASLSGFDYNKEVLKELERLGVIFVVAAGNDDKIYVSDIVKEDYFTVVTSVNLNKAGNLYSLEQNHEYIDYACWGNIMLPHYNDSDFYVNQVGTSFATPFLAAIVVKLLEHSYRATGSYATRDEILSILDSYSDRKGLSKLEVGKGIPILPAPDNLILNNPKQEEVIEIDKFNDVRDNRYSTGAIYRMVEEGLLKGYKDNTFKPRNPITREDFAVVLDRLIQKYFK